MHSYLLKRSSGHKIQPQFSDSASIAHDHVFNHGLVGRKSKSHFSRNVIVQVLNYYEPFKYKRV